MDIVSMILIQSQDHAETLPTLTGRVQRNEAPEAAGWWGTTERGARGAGGLSSGIHSR